MRRVNGTKCAVSIWLVVALFAGMQGCTLRHAQPAGPIEGGAWYGSVTLNDVPTNVSAAGTLSRAFGEDEEWGDISFFGGFSFVDARVGSTGRIYLSDGAMILSLSSMVRHFFTDAPPTEMGLTKRERSLPFFEYQTISATTLRVYFGAKHQSYGTRGRAGDGFNVYGGLDVVGVLELDSERVGQPIGGMLGLFVGVNLAGKIQPEIVVSPLILTERSGWIPIWRDPELPYVQGAQLSIVLHWGIL